MPRGLVANTSMPNLHLKTRLELLEAVPDEWYAIEAVLKIYHSP
jgi:hypothetical protein